MKIHRAHSKRGDRIELMSDDTYTLAIRFEGSFHESTARELADTFSRRTLLRIAKQYHSSSSEWEKIGRALGQPVAEILLA